MPMEPIIFNEEGAAMIPPADADEKSLLATTPISISFGINLQVVGFFQDNAGNKELMSVGFVSETHWVIYCPARAISFFVPREVLTYGDLRKWCEFLVSHPGFTTAGSRREGFLEEQRKKSDKLSSKAETNID